MSILLVEDNDALGRWLRRALAGPYTVHLLADGAQADFLLRSDPCDLVILYLGLGLPGLDGTGVLRNLRARGVATPVLVLTANNSVRTCVSELDHGADDHMAKPFELEELEELEERIRVLLRRSAGHINPQISCGDRVYHSNARDLTLARPTGLKSKCTGWAKSWRVAARPSSPCAAWVSCCTTCRMLEPAPRPASLRGRLLAWRAAGTQASLRGRLLAWVVLPLAGAVAIDGWINFSNAQATATVVQDRLLLGAARIVAVPAVGLVLQVEDNGPGLAPALPGRVFERFFRINNTQSQGCGPGLPIVAEFAASLAASVSLAAPASGQGLLVSVCFAAAPAAAGQAAAG